jgi:gamma-glutamyl:cysteine ligase YbdK (ATP-grasp superfamily)
MDTNSKSYPLFSVWGIEIEYMVVEPHSLSILPIVDQIFEKISGTFENEIDCGDIALNNELALHVIELKTNGPCADLILAEQHFTQQIDKLQKVLNQFNCCLMPTGMHPLLEPSKGIKLWPHGDKSIYNLYNKIFDCKGHGWSNLQSVHINLPFSTEEEFVKLHNAIRIVLPLLPALFSSTPICEGISTGFQSTRLHYYANNQKKIPSITGFVVPEFISGFDDYHRTILEPMYTAISSFDKDKILQEEWLNSRGAIARFDRNAIEIRVADSQECVHADFACIAMVSGIIKYLIKETNDYMQNPILTKVLSNVFFDTVSNGLNTVISNNRFIQQLGLPNDNDSTARDILDYLFECSVKYIPEHYHEHILTILKKGTLSDRILLALDNKFDNNNIMTVYSNLSDCLANNKVFLV